MQRRSSASIAWTTRRAIVTHANSDAPRECCGFLVGQNRRVVFTLPMTNVDDRPRAGFRIDPADHLAVRRVLRRLTPTLDIVGVYHSHPSGPATPSARDIAEAHYPDWLYVIVGGVGRAVRAFRIGTGVAREVSIRWRKPKRSRLSR